MKEINRKIKSIRITVPSSGASVSVDTETDVNYKIVDGVKINVSSTGAEVGSTMQLAINEEEIFPDTFDVSNVTSSQDCPVDDRFYTDKGKLSIPAGGSTVKIRYVDGGNAAAYPYTATLVLTETR